MPEETTTLSQRLKTECWPLHQAAETAALPKRLIAGTATRDEYAALVGQTLLHTAALDDAIRRQRAGVPILREVVDDGQLQAPIVAEDLAFLGIAESAVQPLAATTALIDLAARAERDEPIRLMGLHYVREGAHNGNRFLAKSLQKGLGLPDDGSGVRHLAPYGDDQPRIWGAFKTTLDAQPLTDAERDTIVAGAMDMFRAITAIHAEILAPAASASY